MKPQELREWYNKNGMPLVCRYCGRNSDLTKDHIEPKCRVPSKIRARRWRNKDREPETYYGQFALVCGQCNQMKAYHNLD